MQLYWVSLLIQDTENSKPWLCAMSTSETNLEDTKKIIKNGRKSYRVLSAWIDTFDESNNKTTIFHECYVNVMGNVNMKQ